MKLISRCIKKARCKTLYMIRVPSVYRRMHTCHECTHKCLICIEHLKRYIRNITGVTSGEWNCS